LQVVMSSKWRFTQERDFPLCFLLRLFTKLAEATLTLQVTLSIKSSAATECSGHTSHHGRVAERGSVPINTYV
jgi:hypothetical protein